MQISEKKEEFNAVIEGTYHDDWTQLHYKLAHIQVPEDTGVINDGMYKYHFYGKTTDFQSVQPINGEAKGLEAKIDLLCFSPGVVLPYSGGTPNILERPRTVCTKDGRIFIDESMLDNEDYLGVIPSMVQNAGEIFKKKSFAKLYREVTK